MAIVEHPAITRTVAPTTLPLSVAVAKEHADIAPGENGHDNKIRTLIEFARDQFEHDTGRVCTNATYTQVQSSFGDCIQLTHRPISSVSSITYYDTANASQTLATSVYELDKQRRKIRLKVDQSWPDIKDRWDAVTVTYVAGEGADETSVPAVYKQMILLLVGAYFDEVGSGENVIVKPHEKRAYEYLLRRQFRTSYP